MNMTLLWIIINILVVIILLMGIYMLLNWKRKKNYATQLEHNLNQIMEGEEERKSTLKQYLTSHLKLSNQAALELSEDFVEAEKQFMYVFLEQQMKQNSVEGFYDNLCDLLDKYLNHVPEPEQSSTTQETVTQGATEANDDTLNIGDDASAKPVSSEHETSVPDQEDNSNHEEDAGGGDAFAESGDMNEVAKSAFDQEQAAAEKTDENADADWGAAFAESGDDMDEDAKQAFEQSKAKDNMESAESDDAATEEDIDWGEAFAESGDDMDEDAKQAFEAEQQK